MPKLIVTTKSGLRPLGVRGEPLHNSATQLRRVVRRRLGDDTAGLLADPQLHDDGRAIDWYADWEGEVRPIEALDPDTRHHAMRNVDERLADIDRLGDTLSKAHGKEHAGIVGQSLKLAARRPAETFIFLVNNKPVIVCWGYERETAPKLMLPSLPPAAPTMTVLRAPPLVASWRPAQIPWLRTMLAALPLLLVLLSAAWLLRERLPADPALTLATREPPATAIAGIAAPENPLPLLKASLNAEEARAKALTVELGDVESELKKRIADCKPAEPPRVEPPKPKQREPQVAAAAPPPKVAPPPPDNPGDNRLRLPTAPTNDYSFMQGCWRTDPFRHERIQLQPGISSYCFDSTGRGQLEWRRGRTACRTSARAQFEGATLRLRDSDTVCNDGSQWYADQLVCRRGADNVANCSGVSRGALGGPVEWTVNLHKLK
jgi:hypothetical protein